MFPAHLTHIAFDRLASNNNSIPLIDMIWFSTANFGRVPFSAVAECARLRHYLLSHYFEENIIGCNTIINHFIFHSILFATEIGNKREKKIRSKVKYYIVSIAKWLKTIMVLTLNFLSDETSIVIRKSNYRLATHMNIENVISSLFFPFFNFSTRQFSINPFCRSRWSRSDSNQKENMREERLTSKTAVKKNTVDTVNI